MAVNGFPKNQPRIPGNPVLPPAPTRVPSLGNFPGVPRVGVRDFQGRYVTGGFGFVWEHLDGVLDMPERMGTILEHRVKTGLQRIADAMEAYAKENAPWSDRTGAARAGLKAVVVFDDRSKRFSVSLGHSVPYGYYLEYSHGGQWAIVLPTVRHFAAVLPGIASVRD